MESVAKTKRINKLKYFLTFQAIFLQMYYFLFQLTTNHRSEYNVKKTHIILIYIRNPVKKKPVKPHLPANPLTFLLIN